MHSYKAIKEALEQEDINLDEYINSYRIKYTDEIVQLMKFEQLPADLVHKLYSDPTLTLYSGIYAISSASAKSPADIEGSGVYYVVPVFEITGKEILQDDLEGSSMPLYVQDGYATLEYAEQVYDLQRSRIVQQFKEMAKIADSIETGGILKHKIVNRANRDKDYVINTYVIGYTKNYFGIISMLVITEATSDYQPNYRYTVADARGRIENGKLIVNNEFNYYISDTYDVVLKEFNRLSKTYIKMQDLQDHKVFTLGDTSNEN